MPTHIPKISRAFESIKIQAVTEGHPNQNALVQKEAENDGVSPFISKAKHLKWFGFNMNKVQSFKSYKL